MRGAKAKRLRREVYGDHATNARGRNYARALDGSARADVLRQTYQLAKGRRGAGGGS